MSGLESMTRLRRRRLRQALKPFSLKVNLRTHPVFSGCVDDELLISILVRPALVRLHRLAVRLSIRIEKVVERRAVLLRLERDVTSCRERNAVRGVISKKVLLSLRTRRRNARRLQKTNRNELRPEKLLLGQSSSEEAAGGNGHAISCGLHSGKRPVQTRSHE
jgi:hypothetical protein